MKKSLATLLTALILFSCGWTPACIAEPTETDAVWDLRPEIFWSRLWVWAISSVCCRRK